MSASGGVVASVVAPHTPRIGIEANAPDFQLGLVEGLRQMGEAVRALNPDLFVLHSSHWVSTFNWYATTHAMHEGRCIADEAVDLIPGVPYRRPGHPGFAKALINHFAGSDIPFGENGAEHFAWDYASFVPLQYMDPAQEVPVVLLPTVVCSELDENRAVGRAVHEVAVAEGLRVVFVASCALSHAVVRGPSLWPTPERMELDKRFMELVAAGRITELAAWHPEYSKAAVAEMGGRPLAAMIGAAEAMTETAGAVSGRQFGPYAQSSGSGNACLCVTPAAAA